MSYLFFYGLFEYVCYHGYGSTAVCYKYSILSVRGPSIDICQNLTSTEVRF